MSSLVLIIFAIACLSLAMSKHFKDCFARSIKNRTEHVFKVIGWSLLLASILLLEQRGISYVYWCCQLSVAILLQACFLSTIKSRRKVKKPSTRTNSFSSSTSFACMK